VVLNYNGAQITLDCVNSVLRIDYPIFRVLVVDNGSTDNSAAKLQEGLTNPRVEILMNPANEGYAGGNNRGIERALASGADYVWVLNNDTIAEPGCLAPVVTAMEADPRIGIATCRILEPVAPVLEPGDLCMRVLNLFVAKRKRLSPYPKPSEISEVEFLKGMSLLLRVEALRRIGMFDSRFFLSWEDTDISFRTRAAGYKLCVVPGPGVAHAKSTTVKRYPALALFYRTRNRVWIVRRYGKRLHWAIFSLVSFGYLYPRLIVGRIVQRQFNLLLPLLRGIRDGHFRYPGSAQGGPLNRVAGTAGEHSNDGFGLRKAN